MPGRSICTTRNVIVHNILYRWSSKHGSCGEALFGNTKVHIHVESREASADQALSEFARESFACDHQQLRWSCRLLLTALPQLLDESDRKSLIFLRHSPSSSSGINAAFAFDVNFISMGHLRVAVQHVSLKSLRRKASDGPKDVGYAPALDQPPCKCLAHG